MRITITTKFISASFLTLLLLILLLSCAYALWQKDRLLSLSVTMNHEFDLENFVDINLETLTATEKIAQIFLNHDFNQGLFHWNFKGKVKTDCDNQDCYVQLGEANNSNLINENCVWQEIYIDYMPPFLGVEYQYFSDDTLPGFDLNAWVVLLDEQIIYIQPSSQITSTLTWQWQIMPLPQVETGTHILKICAGNSGDRSFANEVKFKQITSLLAVMNSQQSLTISSNTTQQIATSYQVLGVENTSLPAQTHSLQFNHELDNQELTINFYQNNQLSDQLIFSVFYLDALPAPIADLQVFSENESSYLFKFSDPNSTNLLTHSYQLKYCSEPMTDLTFDLADSAQILYPVQDLSLLRPICVNNSCLLPVTVNQNYENSYFAIKVCNLTQQCSLISNVAQNL